MYLRIELPEEWSVNMARLLADRLLLDELPPDVRRIDLEVDDHNRESITRDA